ncbi:hypothetical protein IQ268_24930 [Oculatella sp. LEGE 06141]|uniref:hypothetical protein n=1 Tax=Oculatella sp. LEGE 06141 TaxID=1828648 RepID=UPI00188295EC|nr:hypothetical protein [Oculatella sp. LEGE 06141]MBE9181816.1 hypothetical protein [Oculatella sp. LEGE 06141]
MSTLPNVLLSLLLTSIFSFLAPVSLIGALLAVLFLIGYLPGLDAVAQVGVEQVSQFLSIFGTGSSLHGTLTIGLVCSLVGVLFDMFTFYRYQNLRD